MAQVIQQLNQLPLAGLMLVVTLGYLLGRPGWRGISLGPAGGTLFVGLLAGHLGLSFDHLYGEGVDSLATVGGFGFCLFIYSVGFDAGSGFFGTLRSGRGLRMVTVGVVVNLLAILVAVASGWMFSLSPSASAGILAGALTSAPTFAAVSEVCDDATALSVAFALTFPFGLVGMVLLVQTLPRLVHQDLVGDAEKLANVRKRRRPDRSISSEPEQVRAFHVVKENVVGKTLAELDLTHRTGCFLTRIHRGDSVLIPDSHTVLERGDNLLANGRVDELQAFEEWVGPEIYDDELRERLPSPLRIQVLSPTVAGKSLQELNLIERYRCVIAAVERNHKRIEPTADVVLQRHDVVEVVGQRRAVRSVADELGRFEPLTHETDIAVYAGGILFGLLLGSVQIGFVGFNFGLGTAGGLLVMGLVLGNIPRIGPLSTHVPPAARHLVRELGILLFVSETGVSAGESIVRALSDGLWETLVAGALVTLIPIVGALIAARWILRMRPVDAWGSVAGGMTSSSALLAVKRAADSSEPAIAYAAAYACACVLVTMAGHVVIFLLT